MSDSKEKNPSKALRVYKRVRNIILGVLIAALAVLIVLIMITRFTGGTPTLFGYSMYRVSSGSMTPELQIGDVIITQEFDPMTAVKGDIVTYYSESGNMKDKLVTHRVVRAPYKDGADYYVVTRGDSNFTDDEPIRVTQIRSRFVTKLSLLKAVYDFFLTPWGLLILIALVIFAFFNEIVIFVKALLGIGYEKKPEQSVDDIIRRYQDENNEKTLSESESSDDNSGG